MHGCTNADESVLLLVLFFGRPKKRTYCFDCFLKANIFENKRFYITDSLGIEFPYEDSDTAVPLLIATSCRGRLI